MPLLKNLFINKTLLFLVVSMVSLSAMALDFNETQRLANQGDVVSQFYIGRMYSQGEGVRQDYTKARKWYEKAANQGIAKAQFNLGVIYYHGEGVRQNIATAKELFGKACDNGFQEGCDNYRKLNQK